MTAPLYDELQTEKPVITQQGNQGLWFERFFDQYDPRNWEVLKPSTNNNQTGNTYWLLKNFANKKVGEDKQLAAHTQAQMQLAASLQGQSHVFKASWHFVTGMGNPHPVENGFAWHPTLGVPYLTGAAVKGLVRTYIENNLDTDYPKNPDKKTLLLQWFGSTDKDPKNHEKEYPAIAGELIFFDALPLKPVILGVDIMTPHMGKWYEQGSSSPNQPATVPADWHDPVPVSFLVAKDITLLFSFALRTSGSNIDLNDVKQSLTFALENVGAGGKTATGYGEMQLESDVKGNKASFQQQDECWEKATFQYQKGSGEITATGNKKRAMVRGDEAKALFAKLPDDKRKLLEKQRLTATALVKSQGNMNILTDIL